MKKNALILVLFAMIVSVEKVQGCYNEHCGGNCFVVNPGNGPPSAGFCCSQLYEPWYLWDSAVCVCLLNH